MGELDGGIHILRRCRLYTLVHSLLAQAQVEEQPVEAGVEAATRLLHRLLPHLPALQVLPGRNQGFHHDHQDRATVGGI